MRTLTQGGRSGSCRWRRPGLESNAPMGLSKEEAVSCRFINVQTLGKGVRPEYPVDLSGLVGAHRALLQFFHIGIGGQGARGVRPRIHA